MKGKRKKWFWRLGDSYIRYARWNNTSGGVVTNWICVIVLYVHTSNRARELFPRYKFDSESLDDGMFFYIYIFLNIYEACLLLQTLHDDCIYEFILLSNTKGWAKD